jgi:phage-related protein
MGSSLKDLTALPLEARRKLGFGLRLVQNGETPDFAKPLRGLEGGVFELRVDHDTDTFRAVYVTKLGMSIYVLDAFQKKSKKGSKLPREDMARIKERLNAARELDRRS